MDDALGDLNRSTNRLRRKFDSNDTWIEIRIGYDARRINQVVTRCNYGAKTARLWGVLRSGISEPAREYGLQPRAF